MRRIPCAVVILGCLLFAAFSQNGGERSTAFRKFVKQLPPVDRIEVVTLMPLVTEDVLTVDCSRPGLVCTPDKYPYEIGSVKTLIGADAEKISAQWRMLERDYPPNDDKCLPPDHLLRFFQNDKLLLETQVCTLCRQITLPSMGVLNVAGSNDAPYYHFQNSLIPDASFKQSFENFKRAMLPKVGQQLTVFGLLLSRLKGGMAVSYGEGEIYLFGVGLPRENKLINLGCHTAIKVSGKLQHYPGSPPQQSGSVPSQARPEQFYFEAPNIKVLRVDSPGRPKRKKNR